MKRTPEHCHCNGEDCYESEISESVAFELLNALIKCRIALTPHVFIDDHARQARNMADEAIAKAKGR